MPIRGHEFKREDHVYVNHAFSEMLKDAVRFFHGTPVLPLPPDESFSGAGVYAIYCIAKKGLYKSYGDKINRTSYDVPIYVGKAVPAKGPCRKEVRFVETPCRDQLMFWHRMIRMTIGMSPDDFRFRECVGCGLETKYIEGICRVLRYEFKPVWNRLFAFDNTANDICAKWNSIHSIRFHSKANKESQNELKRLLEAV